MVTTQAQAPDGGSAHLLVRAGERLYGIPAERVRRVVASMGLWPVAGHAPGLVGLGRFGGEPLAVLSLENLATEKPASWRNRSPVIVVRVGGVEDLGLTVDEALDVTMVEPGSGSADNDKAGLLRQAATGDGRVAWCIDFGVLEKRRER